MSAQPFEHVVDLTELVGEIEIPCERPAHGSGRASHGDGPATHYIQITHPCTEGEGQIVAICATNVAYLRHLETFPTSRCVACGFVGKPGEVTRVLGPIGSY